MALVFREAHAASDHKRVNEEWFVLENTGGTAISTAGLSVVVNRPGKRGSVLGIIDPGFSLQAGEKILVVSGTPGKTSQGEPPVREGMRTYHLFLKQGLLHGQGTVLRLAHNGVDFARMTYDKQAEGGVAAPAEP
jgi:hypothetical protein